MRQPARPTLQQFQSGRDNGMGRSCQPQPARQHNAQHCARLGIIGQWQPGRTVDQIIKVGQPAQALSRQGPRQGTISIAANAQQGAACSLIERFTPAQNCIMKAQGSFAGGKARNIHRLPLGEIAMKGQPLHSDGMSKHTPRATKRPKAFKKPEHWSNDPAPKAATAAAGRDPAGLSPTRYGDWVKDGIAVDF